MNKLQIAYMIAKSCVDALESNLDELEKKYISDKGIVNTDGSVPKHLWCMDNDAAFEEANKEFEALIVANGLDKELNEARDILKSAEDELIAFGLSLAPDNIRAILEEAVKKNAIIRKKVLNLAFNLDTSTLKG